MTDSDFHNTDKQDEFSSVKHSVKYKQTERKIRKKRKKVNRLKAFLRFIVLLMLIFLTYEFFMLPGWYLSQDTFTNPVNSIEIINNNIVPDYVINKSLKNIKVHKLPIFLMSVDPIKKELYKIPVMKNIYVRRYGFPARIQIIIRERTPIAIIKTDLKA
ncbi:MAG: FtsQ-type POTRA domain-containing protein, partial [Candidatus Gastranaerophilales bacterium]|nr:FtsQ-type POTRA domain-containing protein [Candidatus Gastranaerophilales bacterium]